GLPPDDGSERVRADDAVATEMHPMLHESHAAQRRTVEVRVHRDIDSLADEQELEHGDVPAELSAPERPRAEERAPERPEGLPCPRVGDAGDADPVDPLKRANRGDGLRPRDRIDRSAIEALSAQGHL